jgi:hypothetical protein
MKMVIAGMLTVLSLFLVGCSTSGTENLSEAPSATGEPAANSAASPSPASSSPTSAPAAPRVDTPPVAAPRRIEVPAGTEISVILVDSISSGKNKGGDQFVATLADPVVISGATVLERGTKVQGRVVDAEGSGRVSGRANMRLMLTNIMMGARTVPLVTQTLFFEAEATKGRDAGILGGGAGIGAAIGAIAGGKDGAAKGAVIGTAAGAGTVLATKGNEVEFPSESRLKFKLEESVDLPRN